MTLGISLRGRGLDVEVGFWDEQVGCVGTAADFSAGETVAYCLFIERVRM